jgi:head-tail adaptor
MAVISSESVERELKIWLRGLVRLPATKWRMNAPSSAVCDVVALPDEPEDQVKII